MKPISFAAFAAVLGVPALTACTPVEPPRVVTPAESACLAATAEQVGTPNVSTINASTTATGTTVLIQVEGGEAPWRCTASTDGTVQEVTYSAAG